MANNTPGTTDRSKAIQAAIDAADAAYPRVFLTQQNGIAKPLLIKAGAHINVSLVGNARATAIIQPTAADIRQPAQNVNCLIFNQCNNPHLNLEKVRFFATVAYTGIGIYCKEGGGADASGQALFSPVFRDVWIDFPSTNSGFLTGAMQNAVVDTVTVEHMKGVFTFEGIGVADCHFTNISLFDSFDHFISQVADAEGAVLMTIDGLHAYSHNRGRLIDVQNWNGANISNVVLEPKAGNLGSVGIARIKNSSNVVMSHLVAVARTGVPQAHIGLEFEATAGNTCSAKVSNSKFDAAVGVLFSGVGTFDVELDNCDLTNSATACVQVNGNCSGALRTRGCKFSNSQQSAILHSVANGMNWISENDEFLNAGLGGSAGMRNIDVFTSGTVRLISPTIGRNNGSAAAAFFIGARGSGTVSIINPRIVGTPPTGFATGAQAVSWKGVGAGLQQTLTGAGAVSVTEETTWLVTTAASALTLADGLEGQEKYIVLKTDGGNGTLSPTHLGNGTTITFKNAGDSAHLLFTSGKWYFMGGTATLA